MHITQLSKHGTITLPPAIQSALQGVCHLQIKTTDKGVLLVPIAIEPLAVSRASRGMLRKASQ